MWCQALNETIAFIFLPLFCVKTYHKSGTLLLILLHLYVWGDFTTWGVCDFFCQVYVSFQFNRKLFRLFGFRIEFKHIISGLYNGWDEVCHTKDQHQQKRGWCFWHWCNSKTTCIQTHKQMIFCYIDIDTIKCWLLLLAWCCCFFQISFFYVEKKESHLLFFIDILFSI